MAIIMAVGASAVFGFAYLLAITFSIQVQQQSSFSCAVEQCP